MTDVPWWGVPVVAGVFALGGVLAAQLVVIGLDRNRGRREDARRWLSERRRIYAEYLGQCHKTYIRVSQEWDTENTYKEYLEDLTSLLTLAHEIELLATRPVSAAAGKIYERLVEVSDSLEARRKEEYRKFKTDYQKKINDFVTAAKNDLNTT